MYEHVFKCESKCPLYKRLFVGFDTVIHVSTQAFQKSLLPERIAKSGRPELET